MPKVIMFVFGGRKLNMELQLPFIRRILDEHPEVEYHVWDLARTHEDSDYLRSIEGERITVFTEAGGFDDVFRHYATSPYEGFTFVKMDDDVVFIETDRFDDLLNASAANPETIVSAQVINNGACAPTIPSLMARYWTLNMRLLDVHKSAAFAVMSHDYLASHADELLNQPIEAIYTEDWLSINFIAYTWEMGVRIAAKLGTPAPRNVAGRPFHPARHRLGDEGVVNTLPRYILKGMIVGHLYFGPQVKGMEPILDELRNTYAELGRAYLK